MDETSRQLPPKTLKRLRSWSLYAITVLVCVAMAGAAEAQWAPGAWKDIDTLKLLTTGAKEGEHWSWLWLVVVDNEVYVRLGTRAANRVRQNTTHPYVSVKIGDQQFDHVRIEDAPDFRDRVADSMAHKYWSDVLVRLFPHPMTARLRPETQEISDTP